VDAQVGQQRLHVRVEEGQLPRVHRNITITTEELVAPLFADELTNPQLPAGAVSR
jgi:hypothetical protein